MKKGQPLRWDGPRKIITASCSSKMVEKIPHLRRQRTDLDQGFQTSALLTSGADHSLLWGAVLCSVRCLATAMASNHYVPRAPLQSPYSKKRFWQLPNATQGETCLRLKATDLDHTGETIWHTVAAQENISVLPSSLYIWSFSVLPTVAKKLPWLWLHHPMKESKEEPYNAMEWSSKLLLWMHEIIEQTLRGALKINVNNKNHKGVPTEAQQIKDRTLYLWGCGFNPWPHSVDWGAGVAASGDMSQVQLESGFAVAVV